MGTKINLYQNPRFNVGEMVIIIKKMPPLKIPVYMT